MGQALQKLAELNKMTWVHGPWEDKSGRPRTWVPHASCSSCMQGPRRALPGHQADPHVLCLYGTVQEVALQPLVLLSHM